ncbi:GAP family protein [Streptomyces anulatus]|uniref:GAP family protein n=1 Tax=Streptomyces anulatus TaxID=1892 RepID=UPI0036DF5537
MGDAIGHMLTSAVGIAISPLPLIAVILMLATPQGRTNGFAFTGGWVLALTAVILAGSGAGAAGADASRVPPPRPEARPSSAWA